jgi:signal transduction histidine kinase
MLLSVVTLFDFLTGFEMQFSIFYLVSICLATWHSGWRLGCVTSVISAVFSLVGDLASGAAYRSGLVPWWNCLFAITLYLSMVTALYHLRVSQRELEDRVEERTAALHEENRERCSLERALLEVSEREQRRIGHDLHDSLGQHLTSAALAGQVLTDKLHDRGMTEANDSQALVRLIEEGIDLARSLARGLAPVELDTLGLTATLRELARTTSIRARIPCVFEVRDDLHPVSSDSVVHLFRIAQEAVTNAIRHSSASSIRISLKNSTAGLELDVWDNGRGIPVAPTPVGGMGMHIMRHRAKMIGAAFSVISAPGSTRIQIVLPRQCAEG